LGQEAEFQTDSFPGQIFRGKVLYLDPFFNPATRTFKVGVLYTDDKGQLKPNMLVRCLIRAAVTDSGVGMPGRGAGKHAPLVVPETAPLITGMRAIVYVEDEGKPGSFEARKVVLGPRAEGFYVVEEGLDEGEMVAENGNFKIDSAVQILAKESMMDDREGGSINAHRHMGMPRPMKREEVVGGARPARGPQHRIYGGPRGRNGGTGSANE
jgi:Cu(I)/Ag(I) efflux system membrane fusion protein